MTSVWGALRARACVLTFVSFVTLLCFFSGSCCVSLVLKHQPKLKTQNNTRRLWTSTQIPIKQLNYEQKWGENEAGECEWTQSAGFDACNGGAAVSWRIIAGKQMKTSLYDRHYSAKWINMMITHDKLICKSQQTHHGWIYLYDWKNLWSISATGCNSLTITQMRWEYA